MSKSIKYALASAILLVAGCGMQSSNTDQANPTGPTPHNANKPVLPSENPTNQNLPVDHSVDRMPPAGTADRIPPGTNTDRTGMPGAADQNSTSPPSTSIPGQSTATPSSSSNPGNPLPEPNK
jgi:hypothetical protein